MHRSIKKFRSWKKILLIGSIPFQKIIRRNAKGLTKGVKERKTRYQQPTPPPTEKMEGLKSLPVNYSIIKLPRDPFTQDNLQ